METFRTTCLFAHTKFQEIQYGERPPSCKLAVFAMSLEVVTLTGLFISQIKCFGFMYKASITLYSLRYS